MMALVDLKKTFYCTLVFLFSLINEGVFAQKSELFHLSVTYTESLDWLKRLDYKTSFRDSTEVRDELNKVIATLFKKSHLSASIDSVIYIGKNITAYIYVGERLNWARLSQGNMEEDVLSKTGYRDKIYNGYRFRYKQFGRFTENILKFYEDNGYPFASLTLDSIHYVQNKGVNAVLKLEKKKFITIDTLEIYGGDHVSEKYLYNYLNIKPGKPYNESNIRSISSRIQDLTFLAEQQPPRVIFSETKTTVQLFLNKKRASRFDGIIGLLQDEATGKVQFTGDVKLSLTNIFRRGEVIGLNWRGLPNQTQDLNVKFTYPYLLNSMFGIDLAFKLYKRDTTFLDVISTLGIVYSINARDYLKVIYENRNSSLISTKQYEGSTSLPQVLDFSENLYGLELNFNRVDYLLNPTRGFQINLNGMTGFKDIKKNSNLEDSLYDDIELTIVNFKGNGKVGYYIPLWRRHVVYLGNQTAFIYNPQIVYNELYRIGGLKTLRGFNEESIFVSMYSITTIEYRFILEKNSYLNAFVDLGYIEFDVYNQPAVYDRPFGFGVGTAFETGAGIFSLSYAIGSQQGNAVDFRGAKIHFGFLNFF